MNSRRQFLFDCSTAMAAFTLAPLAVAEAAKVQSIEQLSYPVLASQINTAFNVRLSPLRRVSLKLLKAPRAKATPVRPGRPLPWDAGHEKFSLIFSGPKDSLLPSAIHRFEHPQLGSFEMAISQIGAQDTDHVRYEAVFNRPSISSSTQLQEQPA